MSLGYRTLAGPRYAADRSVIETLRSIISLLRSFTFSKLYARFRNPRYECQESKVYQEV